MHFFIKFLGNLWGITTRQDPGGIPLFILNQ